jgi:hypothetical protein
MQLPAKYNWLTTLGVLPNTIKIALDFYGVQEVDGSGSNKTILSWRDELNASGCNIEGYSSDSVPWCGLFCAYVTYKRRGNIGEVVKSPLWARSWASYGKPVGVAGLGDILVFSRNGGGHVGFYVAEDAECYHVLGGNQSDAVTITRIAKSRCIAVRRPIYINTPETVKPYLVRASGAISANEG